MAIFLSDKEIKPLIGSVLIDADADLLHPNGIALRLGKHILFHSTEEEVELKDEQYLRVQPGESIAFSSMEKIDFSKKTVQKHFGDTMLMAFITPTTTMMREGVAQTATKVDAGFKGTLNWQLRNSSSTDLTIKRGEPIFKLTICKLEGSELPEIEYGGRKEDKYQNSDGIAHSKREIRANIPKAKIVSSKFGKDYSIKQLKDAGYPFNHIGTELIALDGRIETVSKDVRMLAGKFETETKSLNERIQGIIPQVRTLLIEKIAGLLVGIIAVLSFGYTLLTAVSEKADNTFLFWGSLLIGSIAVIVSVLIIRKK